MLLQIKYRYIGFDYLAADGTGNLYLLPHFRFRRTVYFKKLEPFINSNKKAIKYHGTTVSFRQLKQKAYLSKEIIEVH